MYKPLVLALTLLAGIAVSPRIAANPAQPALIVEPDDGLSGLSALVAGAITSIDLTMYALEDPDFEQALIDAAARGVTVRVILDQNNESGANQAAHDRLSTQGVQVHWANPAFACTHQKTLTVDGNVSAVMTLNLQPQYYATSCDFAVIDSDPTDVAAIEATFDDDFADGSAEPAVGSDLVWSPTNATSSLHSLIEQSRSSLEIENEEMSDSVIVSALEAAARRQVDVTVVMTANSRYTKQLAALKKSGVHVAIYPASAPLYIHAKVILADYGTSTARAFVGSQNFSVPSLTRNRELGLIITDPAVLAALDATITNDYAGATPR